MSAQEAMVQPLLKVVPILPSLDFSQTRDFYVRSLGFEELDAEACGHLAREVGVEEGGEGDAVEELHGEEAHVGAHGVELPEVEDADDVGVNEAGGEAGFADEAQGAHAVLFGAAGEEELEGDGALCVLVEGAKDGAHGALPEERGTR